MKKNRPNNRRRLWVEELETRLVPSAVVSTNWSGYAALPLASSTATFSAVSGTWTVPAVAGTGTAYTSIWVGLDGYSSNTVEQIGTDSDIVNGVPTYYAWYETYPNPSMNIASYSSKTKTGVTVNPGDQITASVTYTGSTFALTITDTTSSESYSPKPQTVKNAKRSSAEWVVEAPSDNRGILPLSNFTAVNFKNAQATLTGATTSGPIDSPSWQNTAINMETAGGVPEANTGPISDATNPSSFTVNDVYVLPPPPPAPTSRHHRGWYSTNDAAQPVFIPVNNNASMLLSDASFVASQTAPTVSAAAPPVAIPMSPAPTPWMSLTGPAAGTAEGDADADAVRLDADFVLAHDLFHPAALALSTATPNAASEAALPQVVADETRHDAVLVSEAAAVSSAPPASQPEPRGNFVTKTMSTAFWLVAGLAFVSHRAFARGKRQTALHQDENERDRS